jgi:hypothetical protein
VSVVLAPFLSSQTTPAIDALHFKDVNMVKLFKSFLAAGVICGVHHLVSLQLNNEILGAGGASIRYWKFFCFLIKLQNLNFIRGFCACIMYIWFGLISVLRGMEFHGKSSM